MKKYIGLLIILAVSVLCVACSETVTEENPESEVVSLAGNSELVENESEEVVSEEESVSPSSNALEVELSGNAEESFTAEEDCYVEGEQVIIYIQSGVTINQDVLNVTEDIMASLSETTGLSFDKKFEPDSDMSSRDMYFEEGAFTGLNEDATKVNVMIVNLEDGAVPWAWENNAILDDEDYDFELTGYQAIYHELTHVLQFRNGVALGSTLDEGYATYVSAKAQQSDGIVPWSAMQYYYPYDFDDSVIFGGESSFHHAYNDREIPYQYGFRFVSFLMDTYGEDVYINILNEATAQGFNNSYDPENEEESMKEDTVQMIEIIKSQTSEDVFEQFIQWYNNKWSGKCQEFMDYTGIMNE